MTYLVRNPFPDVLHFDDAGFVRGSRVFELTAPFVYRSIDYGRIEVPCGFKTDGASIPRVFWPIIGPFGKHFRAAVVHDYLYSHLNKRLTRAEADQVFLEAMKDAEVPWIQRRTIYSAVRIFGFFAFKSPVRS